MKAKGRRAQALPPRPRCPRSLVGMTMGARKRAARLIAAILTPNTSEPAEHEAAWNLLRAQYGRQYRIGERLRPCLGCFACLPANGLTLARACDGSGVLPAQRQRRAA